MAVALGVATALEALGIDVQTKWPNDLLVKRRKICGILAERCAPEATVVGLGLNVNMRADEAAEIDQPATSIAIEKGEAYDVQEALGFLLPHIETWIVSWRTRGFAGLQEAWTQRCVHVGNACRSAMAGISKRVRCWVLARLDKCCCAKRAATRGRCGSAT